MNNLAVLMKDKTAKCLEVENGTDCAQRSVC